MALEPISAAYRTGAAFVRSVPRPVANAASDLATLVAANVSPERRMLVERHMRRVYGDDYGGADLRRSVHATFRSYGRYWVDSFRLPGMSIEEIESTFSYVGFGRIEAAVAGGLGPIIVLPHLGGWEWAAFWLTRVARMPITVVVESVEPQELFDFFADFRRGLGMNIVPTGPGAGAEVLRAIKQGHVVCLLADRDIEGDGIEVDFFGERTTMPAGPAVLALRTGAPLLPSAIYFSPGGHRAVIGEPVDVRREGRLRADVARVSQQIADRLEVLIRAAPEQWHLQQPNWPTDYDALDAIGKPQPRPPWLVAKASPS